MAAQKKPMQEQVAEDYVQSMFQDGNNRTETNQKVHDAPAYDRAAHTGEAFPDSIDNDTDISASATTFHSRDGTDASGRDDEDGGHLGGTEAELDALEAGGTPVDKNPRMKN